MDVSSIGSSSSARKRKKMGVSEKTELNAEELKRHFSLVWSEDSQVLTYLFPMLAKSNLKIPMDVFFIDVLAVPPPKTRPCQFTGKSYDKREVARLYRRDAFSQVFFRESN